MTHISKGANMLVPNEPLRVAVCRLAQPGAPVVDASVLLLDAAGKVRGDADLVFYNQPSHPSGTVRHLGGAEGGGQLAEWLQLDLDRIEPAVRRVLITGSCDGGTFGSVPGLSLQASTVATGAPVVTYAVLDASTETAFVLGEFYRRDGAWRFRAVGQGYATGLAGLATDFGIVVDDAAPQGGSRDSATGAPGSAQGAPPPVPRFAIPPYAPPGHAAPPQHTAPQQHTAPPQQTIPQYAPPAHAAPPQHTAPQPHYAPPPYAPPRHTLPPQHTTPQQHVAPPQAATPHHQHPVPPQGTTATRHPVPPQDARPVSFGPEFPAYVRRGRGNDVLTVDVPLPAGPVLVEAWHQGDGYFCVHTLDQRNKDDELLFNSTLTDFRGRAPVEQRGDRPLRLHVEGDNDWTIVVQPMSAARELGTALQGFGPEVLTYSGPVADLDVHFAGDEDESGCFTIYTAPPGNVHDDKRDLLVNEIGPLRQTAPLTEGPMILILDAEGPWTLGVRPLALPDPVTARATGTYQGRGDTTVTLVNPAPGRAALLEYEIRTTNGWGYHAELLDEYDEKEPFLEARNDGDRGRVVVFREGEPELRIRLSGVADWTLRLLSLDQAPPFTDRAEGHGRAVFRYAGPPTLLTLQRLTSGDDWLTVHTVHPTGRTAICAQAGARRPVLGPVWVTEAGECLISVRTTPETGWRIGLEPLSGATSFDRKVSGRGYSVVRYTGAETDQLLAHDPRGGAALVVVWQLDGRLQPVRRFAASPGLYHLPPGFLQIRTGTTWALERDG
ncbi:TerD family protein [Streptomyces sp. LX-29]|uniref:TerD family protein n=1 Tax=Streptomyces sp. LX-29 TaxID=2900152 RepID=UPI00240DA7CC|nr:TerD family protein [Streptomyces sp. LX-29]WFB05823.1 TerD family protein [Streptomyces sp. LX-29]